MTEGKEKYTYLKIDCSRTFKRKDNDIVLIEIRNVGRKRLKIDYEIDRKINKILSQLFLDNGEYISITGGRA